MRRLMEPGSTASVKDCTPAAARCSNSLRPINRNTSSAGIFMRPKAVKFKSGKLSESIWGSAAICWNCSHRRSAGTPSKNSPGKPSVSVYNLWHLWVILFQTGGVKMTQIMRTARYARVVVGLSFIVMCAPPRAAAQTLYGEIVGNVRDASEAVVAGAKVTITKANTNPSRQTVTNEVGGYSLPTVEAGTYTVR